MVIKVYMKVYDTGYGLLVSICDKEVFGKEFKEGEVVLKVSEPFYGGDEVPIETALEYLRNASIANIVGKNIVNAAIEAGLIHKDAILTVKGVPHAQLVRIEYGW